LATLSASAAIPIVLATLLVVFGIPGWALVDIYRRPAETFEVAGRSKANWAIGVAFSTLLIWPFGLGVAICYLTSVRRRLSESSHE
jgi:Protein of unknown function (DUF2516)